MSRISLLRGLCAGDGWSIEKAVSRHYPSAKQFDQPRTEVGDQFTLGAIEAGS